MPQTVSEELFEFIERHKTEDPHSLRLKYSPTAAMPWIHMAINHIEAMRKSARKFGDLQPELMATPLSVEQASSVHVARLHGAIAKTLVPEAKSFLDMTCGLGIDFKAISEALGSECHSIAVELNQDLATAARYNFRNSENITVVEGDSISFLENTPIEKFDLIFIDPARRDRNGGRVYNIHDCQPDVSTLIDRFREKASCVMVKLSPMLDVTSTLYDLPCTEIHVIDDGKECREILAILNFVEDSDHTINPNLTPIIINSGDNSDPMVFNRQQEISATALLDGKPVSGQWLFEPSPATMKAAPYSLLSERFGIRKLHRNTHLYISDNPIERLPGKWHRITEVIPFSSSTIKQMSRRKIKADIAVRNFPLKADELARRLGTAPGNDIRIVGATCDSNTRVLLILEKN